MRAGPRELEGSGAGGWWKLAGITVVYMEGGRGYRRKKMMVVGRGEHSRHVLVGWDSAVRLCGGGACFFPSPCVSVTGRRKAKPKLMLCSVHGSIFFPFFFGKF